MVPNTSELSIRPGTVADSAAIGRIVAQGWRQAYSSFMSEDELGPRVDPEHRRKEMETWLSTEFSPDQELLLIAEQDGETVGFLAARVGDFGDAGASARITLLYVSPERQGEGIGRQLLLQAAQWLELRTSGPVTIGSFEQNPFRSFYDFIGGQVTERIMIRVDQAEWPVIIYLWSSPQALEHGIRARAL